METLKVAETDPKADAARLEALGYTSTFERSMTLWQNFSLGFTYLSPVVGVYSVFALALSTGGPPMLWWYLIAACGQMLVCLVFGEIVSQFPIAGGLYPWARRLVGKRWSWMVGWVYGWALFTTVAGVAVGAGPFLASLLGFDSSPFITTVIALLLVVTATALNLAGTKLLARMAMFGFICELLGALAVGSYLFVFARHQSLGVLVKTFGINRNGSYLFPFLAAALAGLYTCYGFEACADVAEETANAETEIPRAMRRTIYIGISASVFVCLALILALPDIQAVIDGQDKDPIKTVLRSAFGVVGSRLVIAVVLVSFLSCILSLQAAASRLLFSYARDNMIAGSERLRRLSGRYVPSFALAVSGLIPTLIVCIGYFLQDALATIVSFAVAGIYISFQMVVAGALYARIRGWMPAGPFTLGVWAPFVNVVALLYGIAAVADIFWPQTPSAAWYVNYAIPFTAAIVVGSGVIYMMAGRPYDRNSAPAGDAHVLRSARVEK
jgi:amino acid transporter